MADNPLRWLLLAVAGISLLAAFGLARRAFRRELPSIVARLAWAALAIAALLAKGLPGATLSLVVVLGGLLLAEVHALVSSRLLRARVGGRYRRARVLALARAVLAPSALHRMVYRACALLHDHERRALSVVEVNRILAEKRPLAELNVLAGAVVEGWLRAEDREHVATWFAGIREGEVPVPAPAGVAAVAALCHLGRLREAAAALEYLDRHTAIPSGSTPDTDDLAELDLYVTKARLLFLACAGQGALVERLRRESGAVRRLFHPAEDAWIRDASAREPVSLDPETKAFAARVAAGVTAQSALPGSAASTAPLPWASLAVAGLCVLVYTGVALTSGEPALAALASPPSESLVTWGALRADLVRAGESYRLFATTLLHAHIIHLLANMTGLVALGSVVEHLLGRWRFLLVYLAAGLAGSLACLLFGQRGLVVGASGAICGIMGAGLVLLRRLEGSSPAGWHQRQTKLFRGAAIGTALLGALVPFVSNTAHAGGFVAGALVTMALARVAKASRRAEILGAALTASAWAALGGLTASSVVAGYRIPKALRHAAFLEWECDAGDASGCFAAALVHDLAQGVPRRAERAAALYRRACDGGSSAGCNNLGVLHGHGDGVPRDPARAAELYQRACPGSPRGCLNLARSYEAGNGVPQDTRRAVELYRESCGAGEEPGCQRLRELGAGP